MKFSNPAPIPMSGVAVAQLGAGKKPDLRSIATAWSAPLARLGNNRAAANRKLSFGDPGGAVAQEFRNRGNPCGGHGVLPCPTFMNPALAGRLG